MSGRLSANFSTSTWALMDWMSGSTRRLADSRSPTATEIKATGVVIYTGQSTLKILSTKHISVWPSSGAFWDFNLLSSSGLETPRTPRLWTTECARATRSGTLRQHPSPTLQPGQSISLSTCNLWLHLLCEKLSPWYVGPFIIIGQISMLHTSLCSLQSTSSLS